MILFLGRGTVDENYFIQDSGSIHNEKLGWELVVTLIDEAGGEIGWKSRRAGLGGKRSWGRPALLIAAGTPGEQRPGCNRLEREGSQTED
jgi:hypothetical protein